MKFFVFKKGTFFFLLAVGLVLVTISAWFILKTGDTVVFNQSSDDNIREIHMVTGEFSSRLKDGKVTEAYRFDPGSIVLEKGETIRLSITGINGDQHPFYIEGTKIKGIVKKGEETVLSLKFNKEGTYRLICKAHPDRKHNGPMIAYIVVD